MTSIIRSGGIPSCVSSFFHVLCNSPSHVPCKSGNRTSQPLKTRSLQSHLVNTNETMTKIVTTSGSFLTASQFIESGVPESLSTTTQTARVNDFETGAHEI